jgi:mannose-6-phosphate isomerase-like protein (cupin superfamily)
MYDMTAEMVLRGPGDGATIQGPAGGALTFKVRGRQSKGTLTAFENIIAPHDGPPLHLHENEDEVWYVLAGRLRFKMAGRSAARSPAHSFSCPDAPRTASK